MRRREKTRERLQENTEEWDYIVEKLKLYWSPEQIAARWRLDYPEQKTFCFSTIYRAIKKEKLPGIREKTHLRRRGKGYTPRNSCYNSIQPDRLVTDWPEEIRKRTRIGDWEGDTIYGGVGKGGLVTLLDRKTRVVRAELLMKRESGLTKDTVVAALRGYPVHSITFDNGSEFAQFHEMESELNTVVYFAEPHKPWQRGSNENANDILRFFFPKGFDFRQVTQEDVDFVVDLINSRPRKILGWNSPIALFRDEFPVALT